MFSGDIDFLFQLMKTVVNCQAQNFVLKVDVSKYERLVIKLLILKC